MRPLLILSVVFFVLAALSAFATGVKVNETGFIALGLAAYVGDQLMAGAGVTWHRPVARRSGRRFL